MNPTRLPFLISEVVSAYSIFLANLATFGRPVLNRGILSSALSMGCGMSSPPPRHSSHRQHTSNGEREHHTRRAPGRSAHNIGSRHHHSSHHAHSQTGATELQNIQPASGSLRSLGYEVEIFLDDRKIARWERQQNSENMLRFFLITQSGAAQGISILGVYKHPNGREQRSTLFVCNINREADLRWPHAPYASQILEAFWTHVARRNVDNLRKFM